ncbi:hypothetical protein ACRAWD_31730 [Caulobacter segnis]
MTSAAWRPASSPIFSIFDADPLADIANVEKLGQVMKNGRLYDAATLDEVWPVQRPLPRQWFAGEAPKGQ